MAKYQAFTSFTTVGNLIPQLATFAAGNGWTINSQTSTALAIEKSGTIFEVVRYSDTATRLYATMSGGIRTTTSVGIMFQAGQPYLFVSAGRSLLVGYYNTTNSIWLWGGLSFLGPMQGVTGGAGLICNGNGIGSSSSSVSPFARDISTYSTFYIDGAWTAASSTLTAGQIVGLGTNDSYVANQQPMQYNGGLMLVPVYMFKVHTDTAYLRPVGCLENVYRVRLTRMYNHGDVITINGSEYLAVSHDTERHMLIKLE